MLIELIIISISLSIYYVSQISGDLYLNGLNDFFFFFPFSPFELDICFCLILPNLLEMLDRFLKTRVAYVVIISK